MNACHRMHSGGVWNYLRLRCSINMSSPPGLGRRRRVRRWRSSTGEIEQGPEAAKGDGEMNRPVQSLSRNCRVNCTQRQGGCVDHAACRSSGAFRVSVDNGYKHGAPPELGRRRRVRRWRSSTGRSSRALKPPEGDGEMNRLMQSLSRNCRVNLHTKTRRMY